MPARWLSFWGLITPPEGHAPPRLWPWLVAAGAGILIAVAVIWFKYGWDIEELTTEFLVLTSFVILIGLALLKVTRDRSDESDRDLEAGSDPGRGAGEETRASDQENGR